MESIPARYWEGCDYSWRQIQEGAARVLVIKVGCIAMGGDLRIRV